MVGSALLAAAVAAGLSGCMSGDPAAAPGETASGEASVSASASAVDPAEAAKQERIAAAQERYTEYFEIMARYSKKSENPFPELRDGGYLGDADFQSGQQSYWQRLTDDKVKQVGDGRIISFSEVEYDGDPLDDEIAGHRIRMKVCIDNTDFDLLEPDGRSIVTDDAPAKGLASVVMQGQSTGLWSVREDGATGVAC
ncbi:hypothetical protein [Myceligenerans indicum]|uniref:Secreted protein n=1 Tax=Myceligenerans indicum TaxID=2593663 RepID=A0ABS1LF07_9MICO|nr:hypothetical protein [Myceligenerans indicum]MBL0884849.1 hypothetical protein [Myceligenerans indicum]